MTRVTARLGVRREWPGCPLPASGRPARVSEPLASLQALTAPHSTWSRP